VVIVNLQATRLDSRADLVIHHRVDDVMAKASSSHNIPHWRIPDCLGDFYLQITMSHDTAQHEIFGVC